MAIFYFRARDKTGKIVEGKRTAQSSDALSYVLMKENLFPVSIENSEEKVSKNLDTFKDFFSRKVSFNELGNFSREMYTLAKTGVPLSTALSHMAKTTRNRKLSKAINGIVESLESGKDIASAMQEYPDIFTPIMISIVKVGQTSGDIAEAFMRINNYIELEGSAKRNLKSALRYPLFVSIAVVGVIILVNIFVIPAFSNVFNQAHMQLPLATRILIGTSNFFRHFWYLLLILIVVSSGLFYRYINTPKGKYNWNKFILRIPIVGPLLKKIVLLRFAQSFAIMISSGIPLIEGIGLIADSVNNEYAKQRILQMRESIERGNTLSQAAAMTNLFTPMELQMLSVSEQTGELGMMLEQVANFYRREIEYDLKKLNDTVEPLLIVVLSGVILVVALAVYLPVWNMAQIAKGAG